MLSVFAWLLTESEDKEDHETGSEESEEEEQVKSESEDEVEEVKKSQQKTNGNGKQESSDEKRNESEEGGNESNSDASPKEKGKKKASTKKNGETGSSNTTKGKKKAQSDKENDSDSDSGSEKSDKINDNDSSDDSEKGDNVLQYPIHKCLLIYIVTIHWLDLTVCWFIQKIKFQWKRKMTTQTLIHHHFPLWRKKRPKGKKIQKITKRRKPWKKRQVPKVKRWAHDYGVMHCGCSGTGNIQKGQIE